MEEGRKGEGQVEELGSGRLDTSFFYCTQFCIAGLQESTHEKIKNAPKLLVEGALPRALLGELTTLPVP